MKLLPGWPDAIEGTESLVPVLDGGTRRYTNLDNAASTPPFKAVREAIDRFAPWYSSVHRGSGFKSQLSTHAYEAARAAVAEFVGADPNRQVVIFTKHTTEALNKLSHVLAPDRPLIITTIMEHHANMLPWRVYAGGVKFIQVSKDGVVDLDHLERLLKRAPTSQPRFVALAGAYNTTGYTPPIHQIARLAHQHGAQIVVDAAQLVPHRPVNMRGTGNGDEIDFLAFSSHKMYAPFGSGALVAPRDVFGEPNELGGGIVDLVTLNRVVWTEIPEREEAGSPNVIGAVALHAAIRKLQQLGMHAVARHEDELTAYALEHLRRVPGLHLLGSEQPMDRVGALSFLMPPVPGNLIAAVLAYEWGIGVRAGCFCAQPGMMHLLDIPEEERPAVEAAILEHANPGAVRASLGLYNSAEDIDLLCRALESIAHGQYERARYHIDPEAGTYASADWNPESENYFSV
ncbi:MAG: aminotransferase class V-fold PLP-dependent enzyme [Chloroflexota bacterium]